MRGDYDIVEDINVEKNNSKIDKKFIKRIVIALIFVVLCGICFNVVYQLSIINIQNNEESSTNNKSNSTKVFIIEQKLRKDLNKIQNNN